MNQARRLKRIRKEAAVAAQAAAEAAVPSKKIKFVGDGKNTGKLDIGSDSDDANADIIVKFSKSEQSARKKAAVKAHNAIERDATEPKMSKRKMKALAKLKERKERESKREELFASLAKHHVDSRAVGLLKASSSLGAGKETKKQKLSRAIKEERAGLAVTATSDLVIGMESRSLGESARARRKRLEREQEERERAMLNSSSSGSDADSDEEDADGSGDQADAEAQESAGESGAAMEVDKEEPGKREGMDEDNTEQDGVATEQAGGVGHAGTSESEPAERKPAFYVTVKRHPEMQQARSKLPMFSEEQQVMEAIGANDVIVLCGATGCGKSTQLPQFLFEAGYGHEQGVPGMIGCTQPRRVAAITTAKRIAKELNMPLGKQVGFQVRYEKRIEKDTKIKVMTDGILLKEIQSDFLLSDYSAIIVDEAHERGINSDVLIGLLSRLVPMRRKGMKKDGRLLPPLKLVIMSATLRVTDFTENPPLFPIPPPVIEVSARQHPVTVHFNRRTPVYEYLQEALKKACKIHRKLPGGGILIFLTGRREIDWMCRNLREELDHRRRRKDKPKPCPQVGDDVYTLNLQP
jgi:ATP-dependent RNA helicase DHX37/DHR1